jgi:arylformamidase
VIYDVTRTVSETIAVWPGDTRFSYRWTMRMDEGDAVNVSSLTMSPHTGTHVDAPLHYMEKGIPMCDVPLDVFLGPARVVALDVKDAILPEHLNELDLRGVTRLIVKTPASLREDGQWESEFAYLSKPAAELLCQIGVRLFGTDAPSVDPQTSKTMDAHRALGKGNVIILEALALREVPPGDYELIALPLKVVLDGSPVRAVLRSI